LLRWYSKLTVTGRSDYESNSSEFTLTSCLWSNIYEGSNKPRLFITTFGGSFGSSLKDLKLSSAFFEWSPEGLQCFIESEPVIFLSSKKFLNAEYS